MIRCEDVLREVSNYLDQDVSPELRRQIEEHIEACENCHVLVSTTRKTISLVGEHEIFEIPPEVSGRLLERIAEQAAPRASRSNLWGVAVLSGLAAMLLLGSPVLRLQERNILEGTISDISCGAQHGPPGVSAAECTLRCVDHGFKYALVVGTEVYELDGMAEDLRPLAGQKVRLTGNVSGRSVQVESVSSG